MMSESNVNSPITSSELLSPMETPFSQGEFEEMMAIEIHFGKGRKDIMLVHFGDEPDELAKAFVIKHNLKTSAEPLISKHIADTIAEFRNANEEIRPQSPELDDNERTEIEVPHPISEDQKSGQPPRDLPTPAVPNPEIQNNTKRGQYFSDQNFNFNEFASSSTNYDEILLSNNGEYRDRDGSNDHTLIKTEYPETKVFNDRYESSKPTNYFDSQEQEREQGQTLNEGDLLNDSNDNDYSNDNDNDNEDNRHEEDNENNEEEEDFIIASNDFNDPNDTSVDFNSEEEMFNRLKKSYGAAPHQKFSGYHSNNNNNMTSSQSYSHLKPAASSLSLSKSSVNTSKSSVKKWVGKSANERLYMSAAVSEDKKQKIRTYEKSKLEKDIASQQYRVQGRSKAITNRLVSQCSNFGQRLHEDGTKERDRKQRLVQERLQQRDEPTTWSCAKCGLIQEIFRPVGSNGLVSAALGKGAGGHKHVLKVCKQCKWNQSSAPDFKPQNIAMKLADEFTAEDLLKNRFKGNTNGLGLFDFLHKNPKQAAEKLARMKSEWEIAEHENTFKPEIPGYSKVIIQRQVRKEGKQNNNNNENNINNNIGDDDDEVENILCKDEIGKYFLQPAHERLFRTKHRKTVIVLPDDVQQNTRAVSAGSGGTSNNNKKQPQQEIDKLVERLSYEYLTLQSRRQARIAQSIAEDSTTGQRLFQPMIPSWGPTSNTGTSKRDVFSYLTEEHQQKLKKQELHEEQANKAIDMQHRMYRAAALPQSNNILRQSTERSVEEMFKILLAGVIFDQDCMHEGLSDEQRSRLIGEEASHITDWGTMQLDLGVVNFDMMIPEVKHLLMQVKAERMLTVQSSASTGNEGMNERDMGLLLTDYNTFRTIVLKVIKLRDGTGKRYIVAPKQKSEVVKAMLEDENKEYTFTPAIDPTSLELSKLRKGRGVDPIVKSLYIEADVIKAKVEAARRSHLQKVASEHPFKPTLIAPPKSVRAHYWGCPKGTLEGHAAEEDKSKEEEDETVMSHLTRTDEKTAAGNNGMNNNNNSRSFSSGRVPQSLTLSIGALKKGDGKSVSPDLRIHQSNNKSGPLFKRSLSRSQTRDQKLVSKSLESTTTPGPTGGGTILSMGSSSSRFGTNTQAPLLPYEQGQIRTLSPPPPPPAAAASSRGARAGGNAGMYRGDRDREEVGHRDSGYVTARTSMSSISALGRLSLGSVDSATSDVTHIKSK